MQQELIITGAKASSGEFEGRVYDSTKIYVQTRMNTDNGDMVGYATTEYNWGASTNFAKIRDLKYPFKAVVDIEIMTSGKNSKMVIVDVQPLPPIQQSK